MIHKVKLNQDKTKIIPDDLKKWENKFYKFKPCQELTISIEPHKVIRSPEQNKYYWGVCIKDIEKETGQDGNTIHEFFKKKFLGWELKKDGGVIILTEADYYSYMFRNKDKIVETPILRSTTDLNIPEFMAYLHNIKSWANEFLNCKMEGLQ